ncbi:hypothetical protein PAYE108092_18520 [Paracoccus yeei]
MAALSTESGSIVDSAMAAASPSGVAMTRAAGSTSGNSTAREGTCAVAPKTPMGTS